MFLRFFLLSSRKGGERKREAAARSPERRAGKKETQMKLLSRSLTREGGGDEPFFFLHLWPSSSSFLRTAKGLFCPVSPPALSRREETYFLPSRVSASVLPVPALPLSRKTVSEGCDGRGIQKKAQNGTRDRRHATGRRATEPFARSWQEDGNSPINRRKVKDSLSLHFCTQY